MCAFLAVAISVASFIAWKLAILVAGGECYTAGGVAAIAHAAVEGHMDLFLCVV